MGLTADILQIGGAVLIVIAIGIWFGLAACLLAAGIALVAFGIVTEL